MPEDLQHRSSSRNSSARRLLRRKVGIGSHHDLLEILVGHVFCCKCHLSPEWRVGRLSAGCRWMKCFLAGQSCSADRGQRIYTHITAHNSPIRKNTRFTWKIPTLRGSPSLKKQMLDSLPQWVGHVFYSTETVFLKSMNSRGESKTKKSAYQMAHRHCNLQPIFSGHTPNPASRPDLVNLSLEISESLGSQSFLSFGHVKPQWELRIYHRLIDTRSSSREVR